MKALIKHTNRHLYVTLTETERKERAELLLRNLADYDQALEQNAKAFKDDMEGIWKNVTAHLEAMEKGVEQLVGCTEYLDELNKRVITVRNDTGEEISSCVAMEEDYQQELTI